jgi:hypothetical protein
MVERRLPDAHACPFEKNMDTCHAGDADESTLTLPLPLPLLLLIAADDSHCLKRAAACNRCSSERFSQSCHTP